MWAWGGFRTAALVVLATLAILLLIACEDQGADMDEDEGLVLETVRGMVVEVDAESLISLKALEILDGSGVVWRFEGRGKVVPGFTPSHLNEHKLLGESVEVSYYRDGEALVLQDITD